MESRNLVVCTLVVWLAGLLALAPTASASDEGSADDGPPPVDPMHQWPTWRGPLATGVAPFADPPRQWSETTNVRWKVELPGSGHATPLVWDRLVLLTTAIATGERFDPVRAEAPGAHDNAAVDSRYAFAVLAIDRGTGATAWTTTVGEAVPWQGMHRSGSFASPSPVTDGEVIIASFGSQGLHALDMAGKTLWQRNLGTTQIKHAHGEGSSPALHDDSVIVVWDHEGPSFVAAFDRLTGEDCWRVPRDQGTSWATPIVVEVGGKPQVIVAGTNFLRGYDLDTGRELWKAGGLSANVVASPVASDDRVFAGSSYEHQIFFAVDLDGARGDLTDTPRVLWRRGRGTPYVPSPLLYDDVLYFHNHYQSVLSRVRADDGGDAPGPSRLAGIRNVYGSPVGAAGRVYVSDLEGTTLVLSHENPPKVLARNRLDDRFAASAALAGRDLFLRGERFLYRLAESPDPTPEPAPTP